jgi:cytochrome P450
VNALLQLRIDGEPAPDIEILGISGLIIGGGFDTTTRMTAHALEWLGEHPDQRTAAAANATRCSTRRPRNSSLHPRHR